MLEDKIKTVKKVLLTGLSAAVIVSGTAGCGGQAQPSKYCCEMKGCGKAGNLPICDGEGDNCYCRAKSCCEDLSCSAGLYCVEGYAGTCMCERSSNNDRW